MPVSHFCLVVAPASYDKTKTFYLAALAPLGYKESITGPNFVGLENISDKPDFFITAKEDRVTKDAHFGFQAPDREAVHKFYEAAIAAGAKDNGQPGPRPAYTPTYYAAYIHDANGNNIEACHM